MIGALVALLALPPQLLFAAASISSEPRGNPVENAAIPALSAAAIPGVFAATPLSLPPAAPQELSGAAAAAAAPAAHAAPEGVSASAGADRPMPAARDERARGVDPRGADFEPRAWSQAEQLGFARRASGEDAVPMRLPEASAGSSERLAPPSREPGVSSRPPEPPKPGGVLTFFSSFALVQVTLESLGLAVPQMAAAHGFLTLGTVSALSCLALSAGSLVGGRLVAHWGIRKVYPLVLAARALIWTGGALAFDPALQTIPIAALTVLFLLDYFAHSIGRVAEHTLQVAWFGGKPVASSRFGALRDFVEYGSVVGLLGTGIVIAVWGFGAVVYSSPLLFGAAALITATLRSLPGPAAAAAHAAGSLTAGLRALRAARPLHLLVFGQMLLSNFFYVLYDITSTVFSVFAAPADGERSAMIASVLISAYGLGALGGSVAMTRVWKRLERRTQGLPEADKPAAQGSLLSQSASTALLWAAAALPGTWLFLVKAHGTVLGWPLFAVTPALVAIGLTAQIAYNHLDTLMKGRLPEEGAPGILGAVRTLTYFSYAVSFMLWGGLFQLLLANGFIALAIYCTAVAAGYVWLALRLRR